MCHVVWQLEMASSSCEANQPTTPTSIDRPRRTKRRIVEPKTRRAVTAPKVAQKKNPSKKHAVKTKQDSKQADQLAVTEASSSTEPAAKRRKTKLNKKERDDLLSLLDSVDVSMLRKEVCMKLNEQFIPEYLKEISNALCANEQPLAEIIATHRHYFSSLYEKCQKGPEPFLYFQLKWHEHCSAFILSSKYSLCDINLEESSCHELSETRLTWLKFCEDGGIPVPETNPIMITVSSAIYHFLLDFITNSQNSTTTNNCEEDGDDVYYRFGGSAISDMLHLQYKHIRTCKDEQRDLVSQEISIIQAMNLKDKTVIPDYLEYRDRGYMYFPDPAFLPFLRDIDASLKDVVSIDGFQQEGDNLVKVAHERILHDKTRLCEMFREILALKLPSDITTYCKDAIDNVFNTFVRKVCNTRIQEFLSAMKQQFATKKGLASTVDVNLRTTLLAHHAKLETKL